MRRFGNSLGLISCKCSRKDYLKTPVKLSNSSKSFPQSPQYFLKASMVLYLRHFQKKLSRMLQLICCKLWSRVKNSAITLKMGRSRLILTITLANKIYGQLCTLYQLSVLHLTTSCLSWLKLMLQSNKTHWKLMLKKHQISKWWKTTLPY